MMKARHNKPVSNITWIHYLLVRLNMGCVWYTREI